MAVKVKQPKNGHSQKILDELCNYLGQDLDSPMCKELQSHVKDCPECLEYINSVKVTVNILKENYKSKPLPEELKINLLKILHIEDK